MVKKKISPDADIGKKLLNELWSEVTKNQTGTIDPGIDSLVESSVVSIRFSLPTQILGKLVDSNLDALCLQRGDASDPSTWDARGFAQKVVVPWVSENQHVLGTSTDPYVSLPLRKPRLEANPGTTVKKGSDWKLLYRILEEIEIRNDPRFTEKRLLDVLRSVVKKLAASTFEFGVPKRVSIEQTRRIIDDFLSTGSGGDRGLSVAAALFQTFGRFFGLYEDVKRYAINASDKSTGSTADIECIRGGLVRLAIEVKERNLTLTDVKSGVKKARNSSLGEYLFNAPKTNPKDVDEIEKLISTTFASGTNLYRLTIDELVKTGLTLTGEEGRKDFLSNVGIQLNTFNTQPSNRQRWKELLEAI